jgi:hypothetical protein
LSGKAPGFDSIFVGSLLPSRVTTAVLRKFSPLTEDHFDVSGFGDVVERIALDDDDVGKAPFADDAEFLFTMDHFGGIPGRGHDRLHRRQAQSLIGSPPLPSIRSPTSRTVAFSCAHETGATVKYAANKIEAKSFMPFPSSCL